MELIKIVYRGKSERPNCIISSKVYTTTDHFDQHRIEPNTWNELDCPITYPIPRIQSHLDHKGTIEAEIPHDELFPDGSDHNEVEARFIMSVKPKGQLLEAVVYLKRDSGSPLKIGTKLVTTASWVPQSEFDVEKERHDGHRMSSFLAGRTQERGSEGRKRRKISLKRRNHYDSPIQQRAKYGLDSRAPLDTLSRRGPARTELHQSTIEEIPLPPIQTTLPRRSLPRRSRKRSLSL